MTNIRAFNTVGKRRSSSSSTCIKPIRIKIRSRRLSVEEGKINKEKLAVLGDLMSVFYDDEENATSDQDDLIEELQDIGYFITSKDMVSEDHANTP